MSHLEIDEIESFTIRDKNTDEIIVTFKNDEIIEEASPKLPYKKYMKKHTVDELLEDFLGIKLHWWQRVALRLLGLKK